MSEAASNIAVGVAGWSYPDWDGYVYAGRVGDKLRYVAGYVDMVEVNSRFYHPPAVKTVASWVERTADLQGFFFTAKLHQDITHKGELSPAMIHALREGFAPMIEAGRLRHWLAQFPWFFSDSPEARQHLGRIRDEFTGLANLTLELRHNSWQAPESLEFLRGLGVTVANLDYPTAKTSFNLQHCSVGEHAYLRLHGRNSQAWFSKGAGRDETYNYLYNREEMTAIARRAVDLARGAKSLTVVTNNHFEGKEVVNALQLKSMFTGGKVPVPPGLLKAYPELDEYGR